MRTDSLTSSASRRSIRFAVALAIAACASPATAALGPSDAGLVPVASLPNVRDIGPLAATSPVHIDLLLGYQHAGELSRDVDLVSTPGSAIYHHFVSNAEWNAYFAPSAAAVAHAETLLVRAGFRIEGVSGDRGVISAVAPAATVERYFNTRLVAVSQSGVAGTRYRNVTTAIVPDALRSSVASVAGLDTIERVHLFPHPALVQSQTIGGPIMGPQGGFGPSVLANGYEYPVQIGYDGAGGTVGITVPDGYLASDVATYATYFKIKRTGTLTNVAVDGGYTGSIQGEGSLDTETVSGLAPGANVIFYSFPDFDNNHVVDAVTRAVSDNKADVISNSWGGCEPDNTTLAQDLHPIFLQAAMKGITEVFSSGDSGAWCDFLGLFPESKNANYPATDSAVVAVGGVSITVNASGAITSQTGSWPVADTESSPLDGSGGGVSTLFALPAFQQSVAKSKSGRNVPDLSLAGDIQDAFIESGSWSVIGGTSWSAPAFNALLEEINQATGSGGRPARHGMVDPALYALAARYGSAILTDVKTGTDTFVFEGTTYTGYNAGPGYDLLTGLGTPLGTGLRSAVARSDR